MVSFKYFGLLILVLIGPSIGGDSNSHLFPPGSLGLNQLSEFNVTGPLNSFVEQIQANSQSQPQLQEFTQVQPPMAQQNQQVPIIQQIPMSAYPQAQIPQFPFQQQQQQHQQQHQQQQQQQQPHPIIIGPPNRPSIDPALQQLLNSFNNVPAEAQRNTFIQAGHAQGDMQNPPVISYITCYVGCSHVTNILTNSAIKTVNINPIVSIVCLIISVVILLF